MGDEQERAALLVAQLAEQLEDLRLDGDIERRGRLVGDDQARLRPSSPWRSSLAVAVRPTADGGTSGRGPAGPARPTRSSHCSADWPSRETSTTCLPTRIVGFSDVIGSWKIARTSKRRTRSGGLGGRADHLLPLDQDRAANDRAHSRAGSSPWIARPSVDLPEPLSPTSATISRGAISRSTPRRARIARPSR